jgi:hypothetical protein
LSGVAAMTMDWVDVSAISKITARHQGPRSYQARP